MNVRKRFVAYIMCYVMALSLIPMSVFGADADNTGTDTCEHNYIISKYIWEYEAETDSWKTLWQYDIGTKEWTEDQNAQDWDTKQIRCKAVSICGSCSAESEGTPVDVTISTDESETFKATCQEKGQATYIAKFGDGQGEIQKKVVEIPIVPTAHDYGDLIAEAPASCFQAGTKEHYQCKNCSKYFDSSYNEITDITIEKTAHNYEEISYSWGYEDADKTWQEVQDGKDWPEAVAAADRKCKAVRSCQTTGCDNTDKDEAVVTDKVTIQATCTSEGEKTYTAAFSKFGTSETKKVTVPKADHAYGAWQAEELASCTKTGTKGHYQCTNAGCNKYFDGSYNEITDLIIAKTDHNYGQVSYSWEYKDEKGVWQTLQDNKKLPAKTAVSDIKCTASRSCQTAGCGHKDQDDEATITENIKTAATCTGDGEKTYTANFSRFGTQQQKTVIISAAGHDYGQVSYSWGYKDASGVWQEVQNGAGWPETVAAADRKCKASHSCQTAGCSHKDEETVTVTENITTKATCTGKGEKTYTATFSNFVAPQPKKVIIPATGHDYGTWHAEIPASCMKEGTKGHYQCTNCNKNFDSAYNEITNLTIEKTAHNYGEVSYSWEYKDANGEWQTLQDGENLPETVTAADIKCKATRSCQAAGCGHPEEDEAVITDEVTIQATCTGKGEKTYTAAFSKFGETQTKKAEISATGHSYGNPTWNWIPDGDGYKAEAVFTCSDCDEQTDGHTLTLQGNDITVEEEITKQSTCMEQGTKTYTASVIFQEQEYKDTKGITLPLAGHDTQKMSDAKPASCTADGTMEYYYCKTCKKHFSDKAGVNEIAQGSWIIKAKDHQITDHLNPSTNTKDGSLVRSCDVCGYVQETFPIPKKKMKIEIGEKLSSQFENAEDASKCTFSLKNKKDKKYFTVDSKTGKITVKAKNYSKISKKAITVNVSNGAGIYPVKVTPQIPAPNVKSKHIVPKKEGDYYRFTFKYKIKKADKVEVRCNLKGIKKEVFDRYLSNPICTSDSYIYLKVGKMKKVTFTITAYYGKNVSKTAKVPVKIPK